MCELGHFEANVESVAPSATTACVKIVEEPGAILRQKVATMYIVLLVNVSFTLTTTSANMKVITSIYLNCRPDLRDEWLTGTEVEDVQGALVSLRLDLIHAMD